MFIHGTPQALHEAMRALHTFIGPFKRLLRWCSKHGEQTRCVCTELLNQFLRIHAIVLGLRHGTDAAEFDGLPIGLQGRIGSLPLVITLPVNLGRVEILDTTCRRFAEIDFIQHHALSQQVGERLGHINEFQVTHHARPEP